MLAGLQSSPRAFNYRFKFPLTLVILMSMVHYTTPLVAETYCQISSTVPNAVTNYPNFSIAYIPVPKCKESLHHAMIIHMHTLSPQYNVTA